MKSDITKLTNGKDRLLASNGTYTMLEQVGEGGMGTVHRAIQMPLGRAVAIKTISFCDNINSQNDLLRLEIEIEALSHLSHPNIVTMYDIGECDGRVFYVMELASGGSLASRIAGSVLPVHVAVKIVQIMAHAVHTAHLHQIIHRDLKPANVLLFPVEEQCLDDSFAIKDLLSYYHIKIADWGLAKLLDSTQGPTKSGQILGTLAYMPPEQIDSTVGPIGPAADIYSLGVILYELLTGTYPIYCPTSQEMLRRILVEDPKPLDQSIFPKSLNTICLKCLMKNPHHRYQSAFDLAEDLNKFLDFEKNSITSGSWFSRLFKFWLGG